MSIANNHTVLNFENTKMYVFIPVLVAKSISLHLKEGRSLMEHETENKKELEKLNNPRLHQPAQNLRLHHLEVLGITTKP